MGAFVLFDYSNGHSLETIARWKRDIDAKCSLPDGKRLPVILMANKTDLPRSPDLPDDLEISQMVQDNGFIPKWFKASAKTGEGEFHCLFLF